MARAPVPDPDLDPGMLLLRAERGLISRLTRELNLSSGAISQWDRVPERWLLAVERISGIHRHLLRPDIIPPPGYQIEADASKGKAA